MVSIVYGMVGVGCVVVVKCYTYVVSYDIIVLIFLWLGGRDIVEFGEV